VAAIGNDYDFSHVFARQVKPFRNPRNVLVTFTTSGQTESVFSERHGNAKFE
jgi:phosphoheptose isomerase